MALATSLPDLDCLGYWHSILALAALWMFFDPMWTRLGQGLQPFPP